MCSELLVIKYGSCTLLNGRSCSPGARERCAANSRISEPVSTDSDRQLQHPEHEAFLGGRQTQRPEYEAFYSGLRLQRPEHQAFFGGRKIPRPEQ